MIHGRCIRTSLQDSLVYQSREEGTYHRRRALFSHSSSHARQADDLGGGVFKKRLGKNLYRSLVLARGRQYWVYAYFFAKKDRANIDNDELMGFRTLAGLYARKTDEDLAKEVQLNELVEICQ